jgi:hypothetical protein
MRKSLWIMALLFAAIGAPNAHADSFTFTFGGIASGGGTFTTNPLSGGTYLVTGITGNVDGLTITSLFAPGGFHGNDNELYPTSPLVDVNGISFETADGRDWRLYQIIPIYITPYVLESHLGGESFSYGLDFTITPVATTPEPPVVLLLGAGLLGLVVIGRKRFAAAGPATQL